MILYELNFQEPEMHISRATYFPSLAFAFKIRCPSLLPSRDKRNRRDVICYTPDNLCFLKLVPVISKKWQMRKIAVRVLTCWYAFILHLSMLTFSLTSFHSNISSNTLDLTYWFREIWAYLVIFLTWIRRKR